MLQDEGMKDLVGLMSDKDNEHRVAMQKVKYNGKRMDEAIERI
jgi:hypothetical protein